MSNGVKCPLFGSYYSTDLNLLSSGLDVGDVCGNQTMTGPNPDKCSPQHPCPGILIPDTDSAKENGGTRYDDTIPN